MKWNILNCGKLNMHIVNPRPLIKKKKKHKHTHIKLKNPTVEIKQNTKK